MYPAQLHGAMDHHGGRTLAGTCPKPAQAPHDAIPRPRPPISNRESTPIISKRESNRAQTPATRRNSNRENNAPLERAHPHRDSGGSPLSHEREERLSAPKRQRLPQRALALGIAAKRKQQFTKRNQQNPLIIQNKTIQKHKKHPSKFVSVRKKSALYFLQLSEILIEPMFRLERKSSQRGAQRKRSTSSTGTPACGRCSCQDEEPKESKARFVRTFTISRRYSGVKAEVVKGRETLAAASPAITARLSSK